MSATQPIEGTAAWRSFRFRPPDPVWSPASALDEARRALAAFDWRLGLWWSPLRMGDRDFETPGRWRVVEWLPNRGNWTTVFYWEGPNGEYRPPTPVQPILDRLGRMQMSVLEAAKKAEEGEQAREEARRTEMAEACRELHEDLSARHMGIRQTFAPGYIRRRQVKPRDLANTNHQRFVREHIKKWDGGR